MKVRELLRVVFRICQVIGPGEQLDDTPQEQEAFEYLNSLIGSWSARNILLYSSVIDKFTLTSGKNEYSWGTGSVWDTARPNYIEDAYITYNNTDSSLKLITEQWYFDLSNKEMSGQPFFLYYKPDYPFGKVFLYNTPNKNYQITLSSFKQLISFNSVEDEITLPAYYIKALKYNIAIELAAEYAQELQPSVLMLAVDSLNYVLLANQKQINTAQFDPLFGYSMRSY